MADLITACRTWRERRKARANATARATALRQLRAHILFFGYDISDLTDEELERGVVRFGDMLRETGLSASEVTVALKQMSEALNG